jgi:hypothetical protein
MRQLITPTPVIPATGGWCLMYVRQAFGLPARYASATEAWDRSTSKHRDRNFPKGLWVPVWYGLDTTPLGHVVLLAPDGSCYSTSDYSGWPVHHPSLQHLEDFYAYYGMNLTYRGWTEDVASYPVLGPDLAPASTPTTPKEIPLTAAEVAEIKKHITAEANRVINYTGDVLVAGYKIGDKQYPGMSKVDIQNQREFRALAALVTRAIAEGKDLTQEQLEESLGKALAENTIKFDVSFGPAAPPVAEPTTK